ncbi:MULTISPECIES: hypothetical protein [Cyanophyceae]|uniref:Uncharacterized protein n=1 Tax=Leptolyngbya subtilissima DQ-A4 TaxID=2933933 RepID=A0ABV0KEE2_9CYAN|nr:hypothetical protein [Nodosilinea sp. FACHB-141]MBD2115251.1 hypothetical protein [Nodosilinea sp. FACHB-141]
MSTPTPAWDRALATTDPDAKSQVLLRLLAAPQPDYSPIMENPWDRALRALETPILIIAPNFSVTVERD